MPNGNPGWAGGPGFSVDRTLTSLQRLIDLDLACVYGGHADPMKKPRAWLERALELGRAGQWELGASFNYYVVPEALRHNAPARLA